MGPHEDEDSRRRSARKLQKKRHGPPGPGLDHVPEVELPPNLRGTDDAADEDITSPKGHGNMFTNMNQSLFGLMVAAGSNIDFERGQSSDSSDDEGDQHPDKDRPQDQRLPNRRANLALGAPVPGLPGLAQTTVLPRRTQHQSSDGSNGRKRILSAKHMFKSFSALSPRTKHKSKLSETSMASEEAATQQTTSDTGRESQERDQEQAPISPTIQVTQPESTIAPVMSRILDGRAEMSSRPSFDLDRLSENTSRQENYDTDDDELRPSRLAKKLKEIFGFDQCEDVIAEYPAWFLKNVMLQGYMYITQRHVCFYSYLPKKSHEVAKTGYLSKTGKRNPKYSRFWFRLKGDVFAYFPDSSNQYFPHGQVDLRYAVAAKITDKEKEGTHFTIETTYRTYYFKADSPQSAKEWVKSLQRVIFRTHNDGDSVKICLPIHNVIDVEACPMMDFAETCKIRVIDNDETYAIDEYFFSFFGSSGDEAFTILKILAEDSSAQHADSDKAVVKTIAVEVTEDSSKRSSLNEYRDSGERRRKVQDKVKATLMSPISPTALTSPRGSGEFTRASTDGVRINRKSFDSRGRRSASETRRSFGQRERAATMDKSKSSDSYVQSMEDPSIISGLAASSSEEPSASQILQGSDVFHSPTIRRSDSASRQAGGKEGEPAQPGSTGKVAFPTERTVPHEVISPSSVAPQLAAFPLQRASQWAAILNQSTKRMSDLLATQSMGYVEKVSGMWKGSHKHYNEPHGLKVDADVVDDPASTELDNERFRQHFALPESESLVAVYYASLFRVVPLYGKIYISNKSFCFRSLLPGTRTKLILPLKDIETADKEKGYRLGYSGLCLVIKGHEELFFEFARAGVRDDCVVTMLQGLEKLRYLSESGQLGMDEKEMAHVAIAERDALHQASQDAFPGRELPRHPSTLSEPAILFDDPKASFLNFKPKESLKVTCLTIGSRGDVQPYIAFCKGLIAEGHKPKIATHTEFQAWIEGHGIGFAPIGGDPAELMRICIENGTFTLAFLKEANSKFRGWLDELLLSAWDACKGSDVIIESPSAMAGIHIAERLSVPYFRAFTMPWTRTRAYPHAFIVPENRLGGSYNYFTYVMFDNVFWKAMAGQVNRWRNRTLGLPSTSLEKLQPNKVPFLYNFSPAVVPPPLDYSDWIRVTGYWFLDEGQDYKPPQDLMDFINKARADKKKLVYVGFGSIIVSDPEKMTQEVIDAIKKADVRCVLSKGWSDRLSGAHDETPLPPEIFQIKSAPHDWLFAQMDAAAHHGGSGTTGASLRAGIPTIIRPFFGDQFFFGSRVEDLGVGIRLARWGAVSFARALWEATNSQRMIDRAKLLGERIRSENGVETAIQLLYRDLEYARSLIETKNSKKNGQAESDDYEAEDEEKWTFVETDGSDELAVDLSASVILGKATNDPSNLGSQVLNSQPA